MKLLQHHLPNLENIGYKIMWSWHWFAGFHFGLEWYESEKIDDSKNKTQYSYFIIDLGCLRMQRCEKLENV